MILKCYLSFYHVDDGADAMLGEPVSWPKSRQWHHIILLVVLFCRATRSQGEKWTILLRNVSDETRHETLYFIKSDMHSFWSREWRNGALQRELNVAYWRMKAAQKKHACVILWVRSCCCFCRRLFLFERMTDEQWSFRLGYLADILWKANKMNLSHCELESFLRLRLLLRLFWWEWALILTNVKFRYCTTKFSIFGNLHNSLNWCFPNE